MSRWIYIVLALMGVQFISVESWPLNPLTTEPVSLIRLAVLSWSGLTSGILTFFKLKREKGGYAAVLFFVGFFTLNAVAINSNYIPLSPLFLQYFVIFGGISLLLPATIYGVYRIAKITEAHKIAKMEEYAERACEKQTNGERFERDGSLLEAAKEYAEAIAIFSKLGSVQAREVVKNYILVARRIFCQTWLKGKDENSITQLMKTQTSLRSQVGQFSEISEIDKLYETFTKDKHRIPDFIFDLSLQDTRITSRLTELVHKYGFVEIQWLSKELGFSQTATEVLLQKSIDRRLLDGMISKDGRTLVTREYVRRKLLEELNEGEEK